MQVTSSGGLGGEIPCVGERQPRLGRGGQVRRPADQPGNVPGQGVQHLSGPVAAREPLGIRADARKVRNARRSMSRSLASPTRVTFQRYAMKRVATSSENAQSVCPSIVILLLS